jgi:hypothetical protein
MANATTAGVMFTHIPPTQLPVPGQPAQVPQPVEYFLSPIDIEDLEYLEMHVRGQIIAAGRISIPPDATPEQESKLMRPIIEAALDYVITEGNNLKRTDNVSGGVHTAYCMLRHRHPDITLAKVREILQYSGKQIRAARVVLDAGQRAPVDDESAKKKLDQSENQSDQLQQPQSAQPPMPNLPEQAQQTVTAQHS